jgi:hypothetical protein
MLAYDDSESSSFVGRLSWPASASAAAAAPTAAGPSGSSGELWDMRRRAFKPREGKERADPKVDTRAARQAVPFKQAGRGTSIRAPELRSG